MFSTIWALYSTFLLGKLSHLYPLSAQSTHPGHVKKLISICRWIRDTRIVVSPINKTRQSVQWTSRFIHSSCQLSITNVECFFFLNQKPTQRCIKKKMLTFLPLRERPFSLRSARSLSTVKLCNSLSVKWMLEPSEIQIPLKLWNSQTSILVKRD